MVSPLLPHPETQGVCQSTPHFLLPRCYSPKCPPNRTYTPPSNGEGGRGKPLKPETWGWGWGEWIFPELVHLWPRARPAEKLYPPITQQPHPTHPPRRSDRDRWEAGTLASVSWHGEPREDSEAAPHLTERNAEAWGALATKTGCLGTFSSPLLHAVTSSRAGMGWIIWI